MQVGGITSILSSKQKKRVLENIFSLSILQAANYLLPLITLPYLVRVLGVEKFGLVAFAQAFVQYFVILTDYGFNLSATREVSVHRDNKEKLSTIVMSVFIIKGFLLFLSILVMAIVLVLVPKFRDDWVLYVFSFGVVFDNVLFPVWFYQGIENMKFITIRNVSAKLVFTILIFIFVRDQKDVLNVPLINSLGMLVAGIVGVVPVFYSFGLKFVRPRMADIREQIVGGWHIFVSRLAISLYTTTNTFILGVFLNNTVVGYYAAGEKIVRMVTQGFEPLFRSVYPVMTKRVAESRQGAIVIFNKLFIISFICSVSVFILFIVFSDLIVQVLLGDKYSESLAILRILSPLLIIVPVAYMIANLGLLPFKLDKYFLRIYLCGGFINILLLFIFLRGFKMNGIGAAWASVLTELILTSVMATVFKKKLRVCV